MNRSAMADLGGGHSPLHVLDPRVRVLGVVAASVWAALTPHPAPLALACAGAFALVLLARIPQLLLWRRLRVLNAFMLLVVLTLPFSTVGEPVWQAGALTASREGLMQALRIALTGNTLVLLLTALVVTMEPVVLAHALLHLRVPAKLVRILMFAIRYIDVLNDSRHRMERAMRARGFVPRCDAHTVRTSAHLVGGLVARSVDRAHRIEQAMRCRGWRGQFPVLHHFRFRAHDLWFGAFFVAALALAGLAA